MILIVGGLWHLKRMPQAAQKMFVCGGVITSIAMWLFVTAWNSTDPDIWWGRGGCNVGMMRRAMCLPLSQVINLVPGKRPETQPQP
jgi:hypothetical protein